MNKSSEMMGFGVKKWKTTHEMLRVGEKNSHNKNNYERMATSQNGESRENGKDLEEKLFFDLQMYRMTMRNTTMNYLDAPEAST